MVSDMILKYNLYFALPKLICIFVSYLILFIMKAPLDRYTIYEFSDEAIVSEICRKVKALRRSCCASQQEFAARSGVSIASVKRIEAGTIADLNIGTLIKIMRACGVLEGFAELVPDVPESPFLVDRGTGAKRNRCKSIYKTASV